MNFVLIEKQYIELLRSFIFVRKQINFPKAKFFTPFTSSLKTNDKTLTLWQTKILLDVHCISFVELRLFIKVINGK